MAPPLRQAAAMLRDIYLAIRSLSRTPLFFAAATLTLAIGIGANTAMFSVLYAVIFQPLGIADASRVVFVFETDAHNSSFREAASAPDYFDWKQQQRSFSRMAGITSRSLNFSDGTGDAERLQGLAVSHDYFELLGVNAVAGRTFFASDDREGAPPVAIISEALWQRRFARGDVVDRAITLDGTRYVIRGIVPRAAALGYSDIDVWVPLAPSLGAARTQRGRHGLVVVGRLADGVSVAQAEAAMKVIAARLEQQYPEDNKGRGVFIEPVAENLVRETRPRLYILGAAVIGVLLIACINVAGLLLSRGEARAREVAIRASLGASRARLVRHFLTESVAIALAGGAVGLLLGWWITDVLRALAPALPRAQQIDLNLPVTAFAFLASAIAAILFGLVPSLRASAVTPGLALGGGRGVTMRTATKGRALLVIGEIALAVVLVIAAGLLLKSFARLSSVDVGMNPRNVVTFSMWLPETTYPQPPRSEYPRWPKVSGFHDALLDDVRAVPGVRGAALALNHPLSIGWTSQLEIAGRTPTSGPRDEVRIRPVSPAYFDVLGMTMLRGKPFTSSDRAGSPFVVVVNDVLAARYFPNEDPVGRQLSFWGQPRTIVGVVRGERFGGPDRPSEPALYPPLAQVPMPDTTLIVRAATNPTAVIPAVRKVVRGLDPSVALFDVETLEESLGQSVSAQRFQAILITAFGVIALLLAAIGLYALVAHQVQQRTNEIGIRLALGARPRQVAALILGHVALLAAAGIAAGLLGAFAAGRFLESVLFEMNARDPIIFIGVPLLLAATALLAAYTPTRRAMHVDPAIALRCE